MDLLFLLDPTPPGPAPYVETPVVQHLERLVRLGSREKLAYLGARLGSLLKKLAFRSWQKTGLPLPPVLLQAFADEVVYLAIRSYDPAPLPVRTLLVQSGKDPRVHSFPWAEVLSGAREVHTVQADHLELCKLPYVLAWVDLLRTALLKAQVATGTPGC